MADNKNETNEQSNPPAGVSRRNLFHMLGAAPIAAVAAGSALAQSHDGHEHTTGRLASANKAQFERRVFDDQQWKTVHVLCDMIIPADDRSGSATQAGVPEFIDDWLAFRTEQDGHDRLRAQILGGLTWLDRQGNQLFGNDFAVVSADQRKQLVDRLAYPARVAKEDKPWAEFFDEFRNLTVSGFFSSKMGIADLPYLGNTAVAEWKGCDPKVWSVIEDRMKNGYQGLVGPKSSSSDM